MFPVCELTFQIIAAKKKLHTKKINEKKKDFIP